MIRIVLLLMATCVTLLVGQGCMSHSHFPVISSRDINLGKVNIHANKSKGQTAGRHCHYAVLFFTIGEVTNLDMALHEALVKKRAEVLTNADVYWQFVWIPFLYTQECWKVEGTAYDIF